MSPSVFGFCKGGYFLGSVGRAASSTDWTRSLPYGRLDAMGDV